MKKEAKRQTLLRKLKISMTEQQNAKVENQKIQNEQKKTDKVRAQELHDAPEAEKLRHLASQEARRQRIESESRRYEVNVQTRLDAKAKLRDDIISMHTKQRSEREEKDFMMRS